MAPRKPWMPLQLKNKSLYQTVKRKRRLYWINKYKINRGCDRCGYRKHPVALDWNHVNREEKLFLPSSRRILTSLKQLFTEIRKCELLCANCHRIHTYENKQFNTKHLKYVEIPEQYITKRYKNGYCGI